MNPSTYESTPSRPGSALLVAAAAFLPLALAVALLPGAAHKAEAFMDLQVELPWLTQTFIELALKPVATYGALVGFAALFVLVGLRMNRGVAFRWSVGVLVLTPLVFGAFQMSLTVTFGKLVEAMSR